MICLKWHPTQVDAFSCTWTDPISGKFFDLRSLQKPEGQSWIVPAGEVLYSTNVCGKLTQPCPDSKIEGTAVALQFAAGRCMNVLGLAENPQFSALPADGTAPQGGVSMKFDGGDVCDVTKRPRSVQINIVCDASASAVRPMTAEEGSGPGGICTYTINIASKHGCPASSNGISFGWIFVIVTIVVLALLFGGSIAWNTWKNQKKGLEALPDLSFLKELSRLALVGCKVSIRKIVGQVDAIVTKIRENRERAKYKVMETGAEGGDV